MTPHDRPSTAGGFRAVYRLRVLRHSPFRRFLIGQTTSLLGSGMNTIGVTFGALQLPGGGADAVGLVAAARILAVLAVLMLGGVATDRLGAKAVMLTADLLRAGTQGVLAVFLLSGDATIWEMTVLAVLLGLGEGMFSPGYGALVPGLVPSEDLADANVLLQMAKVARLGRRTGPGRSARRRE